MKRCPTCGIPRTYIEKASNYFIYYPCGCYVPRDTTPVDHVPSAIHDVDRPSYSMYTDSVGPISELTGRVSGVTEGWHD